MLLTKQSIRMNDLLWKPIKNISSITLVKCYSNLSLHRLMNSRQHFFHLSSSFSWNGKEIGFSQINNFQHLLMQFCSFSPLVLLCARMTTECEKKVKGSLQFQSQEPSGSVKRSRDDSESEIVSQLEGTGQMQEVPFLKAKWPKIDLKLSEKKSYDDDENTLLKYQGIQKESSDSEDSDSSDSKDSLDPFDFVKQSEMVRNTVQQVRKWCFTEYGQRYFQKTCRGLDFTLMSYNILSQQLLESNLMLYRHCQYSKLLEWDFRKLNLLKEIYEADPDIICLQELQEFHYNNEFQPELKKLGYDSLYKQKTGGKSDGCAIFYKSCLFRLDSYKAVEYFKKDTPILNRDNIGLIVVLKPKCIEHEVDMKLCIATTHLLFNPKRGDIKLAQLRVLLAEIDKLAFKYLSRKKCQPIYHPVILCGDMNSEPFSPLYNFISHGSLECADLFCGTISGQKEGRKKSTVPLEVDKLLDPSLNINRYSQYTDIGMQRYQDWIEQYGPCDNSKAIISEQEKGISLAVSEINLPGSSLAQKTVRYTPESSSGQLDLRSYEDKSSTLLFHHSHSKFKGGESSSDRDEQQFSTSDSKIFHYDSRNISSTSTYNIPSFTYKAEDETSSLNICKVDTNENPSKHRLVLCEDVNNQDVLHNQSGNEAYDVGMCSGQSISPQVQSIVSDLSSGCINHNFKFVSAYKHNRPDNQPEVTTHHMKASCTVDYIFYSTKFKKKGKLPHKKVKGPLHLIGYFNLMSDGEVQSVGGLPNAFQSSDHLCLMARFFLKLP